MEFSNFNKIKEGNKTIFKNIYPLERITKLLYFKDNAIGNFYKKDFRWSFDKDYWSPWVELNQNNFVNINIKAVYLYLEIRYFSSGPGTISTFVIGFDGNSQKIIAEKENVLSNPPVNTQIVIEANAYSKYEECPIEEDALVDAATLCGKDCDYYLWRPNHKGQQSMDTIKDLNQVINDLSKSIQELDINGADNISDNGIGVYYGTVDKKLYFKTLIQGTKVTLSENNHGEITISVDDSSINDLYNKIGDFIGINIGSAHGEVYKQKDSSGNFELRTLESTDNRILIQTNENTISFSLDVSSLENPLWKDLVPVSSSVGGIDPGDIIDLDSNSIEILERILYDYVPPSLNYTAIPEPGTYEKYLPFPEVRVIGDFNNNPFQKVKISNVKLSSSLGYNIGEIDFQDVSRGNFAFVDNNLNSNFEDVTYTLEMSNLVNGQYMDPVIKTFDYTYINPFYFGMVSNSVTIDNIYYTDIINSNKLLVSKKDNIIDYDVSSNFVPVKFLYAFDESYGNLKTIWDVKNNFNVTNSFDTKIIPIRLDSGEIVNYRVYLKNHWISFTPEVDIFKLKFNFG
jgi:hypothetical protein